MCCAFQSIRHDFEAYEATWRELNQDVEETSAIQAMFELTTRMTNSASEARPYQSNLENQSKLENQAFLRLASPPAAAGNTDLSTHGDGGSVLEGHLAFLPRDMSLTHSQGLQGLVEFSTGVLCWDLQQNGGKLISLDTLYTQACMLVPIFNVKVQQVAQGARGSFSMMGAAARNMLIPAHEWDRSGWFSSGITRLV
jgi:hypothetical protein